MVSLWKKLISKIQGKALAADITLEELKTKWAEKHYTEITSGGASGYEYAWRKIPQTMREKAFLDLTWTDWQTVINELRAAGRCFYCQKRIKNFCGQIYGFAIKNELCERNYAPLLEMSKNIPVREKAVYTLDEIKLLLRHKEDDNVKMILLLIFTGVRISELLRVKPAEDVFLADKYFVIRKSKTVAGTNRPIPIHKIILPIFKYFCSKGHKYLLVKDDGEQMNYSYFRHRYSRTLKRLGLKHTIHECRHTFASLLDDAGANDMCIKRMLGHTGFGVTQKVYTHKKLEQLTEALNLLKV